MKLNYIKGQGYCEEVSLEEIASEVGTPCYVYSRAQLTETARSLRDAFTGYPTLLCYAAKANANRRILEILFEEGFGADVVSIGELETVLRAGVLPTKVVFSGVGKQREEIKRALAVGIFSFNVESFDELQLIREEAKSVGKKAAIALRINPNIPVKTHPNIATGMFKAKFGITEKEAVELAKSVLGDPNIAIIGLSCHVGSQIVELSVFRKVSERMSGLAKTFQTMGHELKFLDLGGGLGIRYNKEKTVPNAQYAKALLSCLKGSGLNLVIEPGRSIVGSSGVLLSSVIGNKKTPKKQFVIIDAAMNDLIRPCLYDAYHAIEPVVQAKGKRSIVDVVGPVCESSDFLGLARSLPALKGGDLVVINDCGAYGYSMASQYNARPRAPEVLVEGNRFRVIRWRETLEDLWKSEA